MTQSDVYTVLLKSGLTEVDADIYVAAGILGRATAGEIAIATELNLLDVLESIKELTATGYLKKIEGIVPRYQIRIPSLELLVDQLSDFSTELKLIYKMYNIDEPHSGNGSNAPRPDSLSSSSASEDPNSTSGRLRPIVSGALQNVSSTLTDDINHVITGLEQLVSDSNQSIPAQFSIIKETHEKVLEGNLLLIEKYQNQLELLSKRTFDTFSDCFTNIEESFSKSIPQIFEEFNASVFSGVSVSPNQIGGDFEKLQQNIKLNNDYYTYSQELLSNIVENNQSGSLHTFLKQLSQSLAEIKEGRDSGIKAYKKQAELQEEWEKRSSSLMGDIFERGGNLFDNFKKETGNSSKPKLSKEMKNTLLAFFEDLKRASKELKGKKSKNGRKELSNYTKDEQKNQQLFSEMLENIDSFNKRVEGSAKLDSLFFELEKEKKNVPGRTEEINKLLASFSEIAKVLETPVDFEPLKGEIEQKIVKDVSTSIEQSKDSAQKWNSEFSEILGESLKNAKREQTESTASSLEEIGERYSSISRSEDKISEALKKYRRRHEVLLQILVEEIGTHITQALPQIYEGEFKALEHREVKIKNLIGTLHSFLDGQRQEFREIQEASEKIGTRAHISTSTWTVVGQASALISIEYLVSTAKRSIVAVLPSLSDVHVRLFRRANPRIQIDLYISRTGISRSRLDDLRRLSNISLYSYDGSYLCAIQDGNQQAVFSEGSGTEETVSIHTEDKTLIELISLFINQHILSNKQSIG